MKKFKLEKVRENVPAKFHIKKGDMVRMISGDDKGKQGEVLKVIRSTYRAVVSGIGLVTKHIKPSADRSKAGSIVKKESSVHISNLMVLEHGNRLQPTKIGRRVNGDGKLARFSKKTGNLL